MYDSIMSNDLINKVESTLEGLYRFYFEHHKKEDGSSHEEEYL